jgi:hypothetical protein
MSGALPPFALHALVGFSGTVLPSPHVHIIIMECVQSVGVNPSSNRRRQKVQNTPFYHAIIIIHTFESQT